MERRTMERPDMLSDSKRLESRRLQWKMRSGDNVGFAKVIGYCAILPEQN